MMVMFLCETSVVLWRMGVLSVRNDERGISFFFLILSLVL